MSGQKTPDDYSDTSEQLKNTIGSKKKTDKTDKDKSWMKGKDGWEILDNEKVEVAETKPYSKESASEETGEYFENDKTLKVVPGLAKDDEELTQKILDAPEETFSSESGVDGRMKIGKTNVKELV